MNVNLHMKMHEGFVIRVISLLDDVFTETLLLFNGNTAWKNRAGAYFCLADSTGVPLLIFGVGQVPTEKQEKYLSFCQEKAKRLGERQEDVSSWQSRNPDENKWGGAVRVADYILSMAGLPELGDEAVMLGTAWACGFVVGQRLDHIATLSANPYWRAVDDRLHKVFV